MIVQRSHHTGVTKCGFSTFGRELVSSERVRQQAHREHKVARYRTPNVLIERRWHDTIYELLYPSPSLQSLVRRRYGHVNVGEDQALTIRFDGYVDANGLTIPFPKIRAAGESHGRPQSHTLRQ